MFRSYTAFFTALVLFQRPKSAFNIDDHANGKDYSPDDDMVRGLESPPFVSKLATKVAKEEYDAKTAGAAGLASAVAVVTTTTPLLLPIRASGVWMERPRRSLLRRVARLWNTRKESWTSLWQVSTVKVPILRCWLTWPTSRIRSKTTWTAHRSSKQINI